MKKIFIYILLLNLVFNPQGTQLPPKQSELESQYKEKLNQKKNEVESSKKKDVEIDLDNIYDEASNS